ncbi:MAG: hypothetical protein ACFHWX_20185 [Bacteroidota bacterium]
MKSHSFILILFLLPLISNGQYNYHSSFEEAAFSASDPLQIIISSQPEINENKFKEIQSDLNELVDKLQSKRQAFNNDDSFLEWAFYYVHRKKLGWYENYVSFSDIFINKKYDCLTGTILYSILLDRLHYKFSIYEMDYHIFLVVHLPEKNVLFEATDPLEGFINDKKQIEEKVQQFIADGNSIIAIKGVGEAQKELHGTHSVQGTVDLLSLAGLQYFNLAVKAYNENHFHEASSYILKAEKLYPSDRIVNVKNLMVSAL